LFLSLWDFYVPSVGLRPFDLVAFGAVSLFVVLSITATTVVAEHPGNVLRYVLVLGVVCLYGWLGVAQDPQNLKPAVGVVAGCCMGIMVQMLAVEKDAVVRAITACAWIHIAFFWLQFLAFHLFGVLLNYHSVLGAEPRLFGATFRAAGLAMEPAHFALTMYMFLSLRYLILEKVDKIFWIGVTTMVASLSLWGIFAAILLVAWVKPRVAAILAVGGVVAIALLGAGALADYWLVARLLDVGTDNSAMARYGGLIGVPDIVGSSVAIWLGDGISYEYLYLGSSGLGFAINAFGIATALLIVALVSWRGSVPRSLKSGLVVGFSLTAAPQWTVFFWWMWLGLIAGVADDRK
jgi:hypothetical protein